MTEPDSDQSPSSSPSSSEVDTPSKHGIKRRRRSQTPFVASNNTGTKPKPPAKRHRLIAGREELPSGSETEEAASPPHKGKAASVSTSSLVGNIDTLTEDASAEESWKENSNVGPNVPGKEETGGGQSSSEDPVAVKAAEEEKTAVEHASSENVVAVKPNTGEEMEVKAKPSAVEEATN